MRAIAAGRLHNLALRTNGTVVGWGYNGYGQASSPQSLGSAAAIAAGYLHSAVLLSNGTVVVWGDNSFGQSNVPAGLSNVVAIAAGDFHTLALSSNGSITSWGDNAYQQASPPSNLTNLLAISSGYYHGLALVRFTPMIYASRTPDTMVLTWNSAGTLQWSYQPAGTYFDLPSTGRRYTNTDFTSPAKFFRLRH